MARLLREIPEAVRTPPITEEEARQIEIEEKEEALLRANEIFIDDLGREILDPNPLEPPIGYNPQPTLVEQMRAMIRGERLRQLAEEEGFESFEEADDFELDADPAPASPYEEVFEPTPARELRRRRAEAEAAASQPPKPEEKPAAATSGGSVTEGAPAPAVQPSSTTG